MMPSLHTIAQCQEVEIEKVLRGEVNEGCRITGSLVVSKVRLWSGWSGDDLTLLTSCAPGQVAGKLYFAPSKFFRSGYLSAKDLVDATFKVFDTSHTIRSLSFGEAYPVRCLPRLGSAQLPCLLTKLLSYKQDMKNPLNNRKKELPNESTRGSFQYFLKVHSIEGANQLSISCAYNLAILFVGCADGVYVPFRRPRHHKPVFRDGTLPPAHTCERQGPSEYVRQNGVRGEYVEANPLGSI
ncbi:unnamed protein product [Phytophthora fragariaefolia]|uniref:Unnamed protein product n=1 Tax=Phytophthora fragariaefolia TaxID=1490495 RepID=A0A9W7CS75_9STRA|nr:unnamed protein product [Phytophthora fragariaefolia]